MPVLPSAGLACTTIKARWKRQVLVQGCSDPSGWSIVDTLAPDVATPHTLSRTHGDVGQESVRSSCSSSCFLMDAAIIAFT